MKITNISRIIFTKLLDVISSNHPLQAAAYVINTNLEAMHYIGDRRAVDHSLVRIVAQRSVVRTMRRRPRP